MKSETVRKREYYLKNRDKIRAAGKEYYKRNREKIRKQQGEYYQKNKVALCKKRSKDYYANWEVHSARQKKYFQTYKDVIRAKRAKRLRDIPALRVIRNLRIRLNSFMSGRSRRTMDLVGCDWKHLRRHIEVQFKKGMDWENYGTVWHLDHHIPVSAFDPENPREWEACWHFSNLKPLNKKDNLRKGKKICLER